MYMAEKRGWEICTSLKEPRACQSQAFPLSGDGVFAPTGVTAGLATPHSLEWRSQASWVGPAGYVTEGEQICLADAEGTEELRKMPAQLTQGRKGQCQGRASLQEEGASGLRPHCPASQPVLSKSF